MALITQNTNLNEGTGESAGVIADLGQVDINPGGTPSLIQAPSFYVEEMLANTINGGIVLQDNTGTANPAITFEAENFIFNVSHIHSAATTTGLGDGTLNLTNCQVNAWIFRSVNDTGDSILTLANGNLTDVNYFGTGGRTNALLGDNVNLNNVVFAVSQTGIADPVPAALFSSDARRFPQIFVDLIGFDFTNDFNNVTLGDGTATRLPANAKLGGTIFGQWGALTDTTRPASHVLQLQVGGALLGHPDFSNTFPDFNFAGSWQSVLGGIQTLGAHDAILVNPLFNPDGGAFTRTVGGVSIDQGRMAIIKFNNAQAAVIVCNALSARFFDAVSSTTATDIKFDLDISASSPVDALRFRGNLGWGNDINSLTFTNAGADLTAAQLAQGMLIRSRTSSLAGQGVTGTTAGATNPNPTTANAGNLFSGQHHDIPYTVWSYTHNMGYQGMLQNQNVTGANGTVFNVPGTLLSNANPDFFEGQTANEAAEDYGATLDASLNGVAYADATAQVTSTNNIYPNLKRHRFDNKFAEDMEPSVTNGVFTTTKSLTLGTTNSYAGSTLSVNTGATLTGTEEVTGITSSNTDIDRTNLNNVDVTGFVSGVFGAVTNGCAITTTNTNAQTVISIDSSSYNTPGSLTISGAANNATLTTGGTLSVAAVTGGTINSTDNVTTTGNLDGADITTTGTLTVPGNNLISACDLTASSFVSLQSTPAARETYTGHTLNGSYTFTTSNPTLDNVTWESGSPVFVVDTNIANAVIITGTTDLSGATLQNAAVQYILTDGATVASAFGGTVPTGWVDVNFNAIRPEGTLAEIRARGGYFNVVDIANGNSLLPGGGVLEITNSTTMAQMTASKSTSITGIWRAIYKPRTVFGDADTRLAYQTTIVDYGVLTNDVIVPFSTFSDLVIEGALPGGVSAGVAGNPLAVYSLVGEVGENDIVGDGTTATNTFTNEAGIASVAVTVERVLSVTGGVTTELTRDDGGAAGTYTLTASTLFPAAFQSITINGGNVPTGTTIRIFFSIGDARAMRITLRAPGNILDANETQTLSLAAANTEQYVQIHSDYSIFWDTNEMFSPGPDSRSVWTGQAQGTEWFSGDPFTTQQRVSNLEGLISGQAGAAGALFDQVIDIPAVSASLSTVAAAVSAIVGEELMDILENQVAVVDNQNNMQTAIQRGAVKAATYSAGELTTSTSDNFNNPTDDA